MRKNKSEILGATAPAFSKFVARNTVLWRDGAGVERVRLHNTDVLTFHPNGTFAIDTGGWNTLTTRDRINSFGRGKVRVYSRKGALSATTAAGTFPVARDMRFKADGQPIGLSKAIAANAAQEKIAAKIAKFSKRVLTCDPFPMPDSGDCWGCAMVAAERKVGPHGHPLDTDAERHPMGSTCLAEHIAQGYLHGSLLVRAMRNAGRSDFAISLYLNNGSPDKSSRQLIARDLRKLLRKSAGLAA